MSKKKIWIIISLMSISLIGLMGFQFHWIDLMMKQKAQDVDRSIQKALAELESSLEDEEALIFVQTSGNAFVSDTIIHESKNSYDFITDVRVHSDEDSVIKEMQTRYEFTSKGSYSGGMMILGDEEQEVNIVQLGDSNHSKIKLVKRFNEKKGELTEAIEKIAFEFAFREIPFAERIDTASFDSLVNQIFSNQGLSNLDYDYSLFDLDEDQLLLSNHAASDTLMGDVIYAQKLMDDENSEGGLFK